MCLYFVEHYLKNNFTIYTNKNYKVILSSVIYNLQFINMFERENVEFEVMQE